MHYNIPYLPDYTLFYWGTLKIFILLTNQKIGHLKLSFSFKRTYYYGQSGYREYAPNKKAKQIMFTMHILPLLNFNLSSLVIFNIFTNTIIICLKKSKLGKTGKRDGERNKKISPNKYLTICFLTKSQIWDSG